jgi:PIN domain nuclease of toxin-antitoxin system
MKLLLDTHVWVWAVEDLRRLGRKTRAALQSSRNTRSICAVSALEIAQLIWSGDMTFQIPVTEWVSRSLEELRADWLPITVTTAIEAYQLPEPFHRDPADRQIVACARLHELTLVTADERILAWKHVAALDARK